MFDAITNLDLFRLPVARVLLEARGLPSRLADAAARRHGETVAPEPPTFRVRDLPARGWIPLGERPGTELVYGAVGQPWKGTGGQAPEPPVTAETFAAFAEPGFAKLAESTVVIPYGMGGCVLTLESRVVMTDDHSRRRFRRYWQAAGPFIRLMRPTAMRALERQLRRAAYWHGVADADQRAFRT
ncbi:MAG TPA: hypothetical protein DEQ43_06370 [Nocardioides bacterium]|nr:hypothetical protein [Nocardioides sp.]